MNKEIQLKKYNKKMDYSYTLGAFPTIELLKNCPDRAIKVLIHEDMNSKTQKELLNSLCKENHIPCIVSGRQVEKLRDKDNCFAVGLFEKYSCELAWNKPHVVLVNPSDSGNMGTILRTCAGFGVDDIAVIEPAVDLFHPKVVRASMGALFRMRFTFFSDFSEYFAHCSPDRKIYPFMLKGAVDLQKLERCGKECFTLVFGNEASGLEDEFLKFGQSVCIRHTNAIDSLNLSVALGIGLYEFMKA